MTAKIDDYLKKLYYTPRNSASYSSASKLWKYIRTDPDKPANLDFKKLKAWYDLQATHNIHKSSVNNFKRQAIIVESPDEQWDADLIVINTIKKYNDGYCYILACIDLFSRYAWAVSLKTKSAKDVRDGFRKILSKGRHCEILRTDRGSEFTNAIMKQYLKKQKIYHIFTYNELHANYIERWNRTLQDKMYKYFYEHQTLRYVDVLDDFVASYNSTVHSTINMAPKDVTLANSMTIYERVYLPILESIGSAKPSYQFNVGDTVRLSYGRRMFARGYAEKFSEELYKIASRVPSHPPRYKIVDLMGESIKGSFYEQEMQKAYVNTDDMEFKIDKVLGKKRLGKKLHYLVSWYGYPSKFQSYVPASQLKNYSGKQHQSGARQSLRRKVKPSS